jgi:hypothetical protein
MPDSARAEITISRLAVSTLPKLDVDPVVRRVVERAIGRHMRAVLGIEEQGAFGMHDHELTRTDSRLLFATALDLEVRAELSAMLKGQVDV